MGADGHINIDIPLRIVEVVGRRTFFGKPIGAPHVVIETVNERGNIESRVAYPGDTVYVHGKVRIS